MNQELLNQFLSLLEASNSFKLLTPEQQNAVKEGYQNATDDQMSQAIEALKKDKIVTQELIIKNQTRKNDLDKMNLELKTTLKEVVRDEQVEAEVADKEASETEMQQIMQELGVADDKSKVAAVAPRKKFLGIF